jgi:hypothetical protein
MGKVGRQLDQQGHRSIQTNLLVGA